MRESEFLEGQELSFDGSDYNHYDSVEICFFRDLKTKKRLQWDISTHEFGTWNQYFEKIEYK